MSWMAYILATEADVAKKIRTEFAEVKNNKQLHELTKDDLEKLNYTANAIKVRLFVDTCKSLIHQIRNVCGYIPVPQF